jgi:hypothetical protein
LQRRHLGNQQDSSSMNWGDQKLTAVLQNALMGLMKMQCSLVLAPCGKQAKWSQLVPASLIAILTNVTGGP